MATDAYTTDDDRWQALLDRDAAADGLFFYSVKTTGIFCRPGCPSKRPNRRNVSFHDTIGDAEKSGFRPCKRCRPSECRPIDPSTLLIAAACRTIESAENPPRLKQLAEEAGLSPQHFHRLFQSRTGVTPRAYASAHRSKRLSQSLRESNSVTNAIYASGFNSSGRFYELAAQTLGMTPTEFRAKGAGLKIRFALGECWLGSILIAATDKGICCILLGDDPEALIRDLHDRFGNAELTGADPAFDDWVAVVMEFITRPTAGLTLPLDIQGTAFQQRVWQALRKIPCGSTLTYRALAEQLGMPKSVRAVASACAANPIAVAVPCHRVVRINGELAGYRWGIERKSLLLERERTQ